MRSFMGCHQVDEFDDKVNERMKVFAITKAEWLKLRDKRNQ